MNSRKELTDIFIRYVSCASPSGQEGAFCRMLVRQLEELGLSVEQEGPFSFSDGSNIRAFLPGEGEPILLCAHMDTVPHKGSIHPMRKGPLITSDGNTILGADDKAGVLAIMTALRETLQSGHPHRAAEILFTVSEETGLLGARHTDLSRLRSKIAYVFDNSKKGTIINKGPARSILSVTVTGKSAHAAVCPEKGINALKAAAAMVTRIPTGAVDDNTRINVAGLCSDDRINVVPDYAAFRIDLRSFREEEQRRWLHEICAICEEEAEKRSAAVTVEEDRQFSPLFTPEDSPLLLRLIQEGSKHGIDYRIDSTFGGSDTHVLHAGGLQAVNVSTGMEQVHSTSEQLDLEYLEKTVEVIKGLLQKD